MLETDVLLSIIIPCYNGEKFISQSISSVVKQPVKDIELIIVDDGSIDQTGSICKKFSANDHRVKYFRITNHGTGYARNYGMTQATGKWIMFLDADDLYLPDSLNERFVSKLEAYSSEGVDVILSSKCETDMNLKQPIQFFPISKCSYDHIPDMEFWTGIYDRSFLMDHNVKFFEYREQDIESAFRYRVLSKAEKTVNDDSICFYLRRMNPESNIHTWNLFTLHCIRATVYYSLFQNCQIENDKWWLFEIVQNEILEFYKCCLQAKCQKAEYLDKINLLFEETHKLRKIKHKNKKDAAIYFINYGYYLKANHAQKHKKFKDVEIMNKNEQAIASDSIISKRLEIIGKYVQECIE